MTNLEIQIKQAHDDLGLNPEQIAKQFNLELVAVKAYLMQCSHKYKTATRADDSTIFTINEQEEAKNTIVQLMMYSEDEHLRGRMARYIRDDAKGRLDVASNLGAVRIPVMQFNVFLQQARDAINEVKKLKEPEPVDV